MNGINEWLDIYRSKPREVDPFWLLGMDRRDEEQPRFIHREERAATDVLLNVATDRAYGRSITPNTLFRLEMRPPCGRAITVASRAI